MRSCTLKTWFPYTVRASVLSDKSTNKGVNAKKHTIKQTQWKVALHRNYQKRVTSNFLLVLPSFPFERAYNLPNISRYAWLHKSHFDRAIFWFVHVHAISVVFFSFFLTLFSCGLLFCVFTFGFHYHCPKNQIQFAWYAKWLLHSIPFLTIDICATHIHKWYNSLSGFYIM